MEDKTDNRKFSAKCNTSFEVAVKKLFTMLKITKERYFLIAQITTHTHKKKIIMSRKSFWVFSKLKTEHSCNSSN